MPKHTASVQINAAPEKVWGVVSDSARLTDWLSPVQGVDAVQPDGPLAAGSTVEVTIGKVGGAKMKIKEAESGRLLRWNAGPFLAHMMGMPMKVQLDLAPSGEGTDATITFKINPMIAPMMKMMTGLNLGEEAPRTVQRLKQASESA